MRRLDEVIGTKEFASDPFPFYRQIREHEPVQWSEKWNCWIVVSYQEARAALQDSARFSNFGRVTGLFRKNFDPTQLAALKPLVDHYSTGLINVDPPEHTRIRKFLHEAFRASNLARLEGYVRTFVRERLESARRRRSLDVIHDLAHPLPVHVIARLFGVPPEDIPLFTGWSSGIVAFMKSPTPDFEACLRSQSALVAMRTYVEAAVEKRRKEPANDVLTTMATSRIDGETLAMDDILGTSISLLTGGHETTTRLVANTVIDLVRHPPKQEELRNQRDLLETAVEEFLRFSGPFHRDQRVASADTELGGKPVRKGDYLLQMVAAANRDPAQFSQPEALDLARRPNKHLSFGFGPHICLGAHLARLELSLILDEILNQARLVAVHLEPLEWDFGFLRGPRELLVEIEPI